MNSEANVLQQMLLDFSNDAKNVLYSVILDVVARANPNFFMEVIKMSKQTTPINEELLNEVVTMFHLDEKWIEKGKLEGLQTATLEMTKRLLSLGIDLNTISKVTGLCNEEILKLQH